MAQTRLEVNLEAWDTTRVDDLISAAATDLSQPANQQDLETAILISRKMDYRNGVVNGSDLMLGQQAKQKDFTGQLRSLLQLLNFLHRHPKDPKLPVALHETGNIYLRYGVYHKAIGSYEECKGYLDERNEQLYYPNTRNLARAYQLNNRYDSARTEFATALNLAQQDNKVHEMLWIFQQQANMAHREEKFDKELKWYQLAYTLADSNRMVEERVMALNNIGYAYRFLQEPKQAENYFAQVLASSSNKAETEAVIRQNLGILYQNEKDYDQAVKAFSRAANLYSELKDKRQEALIYDFLALTYYQRNDMYNAQVYNGRSIDLANNRADALDVLQSCCRTKSLIHQELF